MDVSPVFLLTNSGSNDAIKVHSHDISTIQNSVLCNEGNVEECQDVQNSGWFEVKKRSRSGAKSSTSKSNSVNRKLVEPTGKGKVFSGQGGTEEFKVLASSGEIPNSSFNSMDVSFSKPEEMERYSDRKSSVELTPPPPNDHLDLTENEQPIATLIDVPKIKWGNLDDDDWRENQLMEDRLERNIEGSSGNDHRAPAGNRDSIICLEGGKQSSAKELNCMESDDTNQALVSCPQQSDSSSLMQDFCVSSKLNGIEADQENVDTEERQVKIVSQDPCGLNGDVVDIVPLHSPKTQESIEDVGSSDKLCSSGQAVPGEDMDLLASKNLVSATFSGMSELSGEDVVDSLALESPECHQKVEIVLPANERQAVEKIASERSLDFGLAASMLMEKFEESKSGESKERFRQRLWCYLFENLNRAIDELYFLCELECDMEQIQGALLVLKEAGLDFTELKCRVEGFDKMKKHTSASQNSFPGSFGGSFTGKVEHRRPHAIAWEVRRMACSPNRAEILSSSLEAFKKVQQETARKNMIRQPKRRDAARLLEIEQSCKEFHTKAVPSTDLDPNMKEAVTKLEGKQSSVKNSNRLSSPVVIDGDKKKSENLKACKEFRGSSFSVNNAGSAYLKVPLFEKMASIPENIVTSSSSSDTRVAREVGSEKSTPLVNAEKGSIALPCVNKGNKISEFCERRVSIAEKDRDRKLPKTRSSLDAWKVKRNWEDVLSPPLKSSNRTSRSPSTGRKSTERAKVLHDKLMSPERKKKSPSEMKKEVDEKQARATRIRRELETERAQRLQRTTEKLNRVSEWQAVRSTKMREGMHARQQRGESRKEAHLAEIARRASDESSKVSEVRFITSLNEENKKLSLRQKLQDSELRRAERLQIIKIKQKEDVAREEAVLERRKLLEAERLQRIAETQRKKEEAKIRREVERKAASAAREAKAVEQVRKKEVRAKAQQEEAELQAQKLKEKLRESELRRKVYLEQIRERAAMESREQASPLTRRPSSRDGHVKSGGNQGVNDSDSSGEKDIVVSRQALGSKGTASVGPGIPVFKVENMVLKHQALKKRVKKIRQRLMSRKYEFLEPPTGAEGSGVGSIGAAGTARAKIGRWLQDLQRVQQARKAGAVGVGFIIGEMIKYLDGKDAELHAARQAGLVDFVATALPASHTSKPEASQTSLSLLRILKVLLALPANRSYFIAKNHLPPLIPMLSTALENFSSLDSYNIAGAPNTSSLISTVDKIPSDEKLEAVGEVLNGLLECVTLIMGHLCNDERQLLMTDDLTELLVACEVIHHLRDLFSLFDRPQIEGAPFPAPVLSGLNLLQTLTGLKGKSAGVRDGVQLNMKFESQEAERTAVSVKDFGRECDSDVNPPFAEFNVTKIESTQPSSTTKTDVSTLFAEYDDAKMQSTQSSTTTKKDNATQDLICASVDKLENRMNGGFRMSSDGQLYVKDMQTAEQKMKTLLTDRFNDHVPVNLQHEKEMATPAVETFEVGEIDMRRANVVGRTETVFNDPSCPISVDLKAMESKNGKAQMQQGSALACRSLGFLVSAIAETGLVGLPSLLTAVLLQTNPRSTPDQAAAVLPSNFEGVAIGVLKVLNNLARLDLGLVQNLLAMPDLQMEFFHLVSFLLSHCTCQWNSSTDQVASLLLETLLLLGYFAVMHPGNQAVLRWGKSPTILHKICDLPFAFFSDPLLTPVLVGTLLAVCYGSEQNRDVVQQELSMEMLLSLLTSSKDEVIKQKNILSSQDFQADFQPNAVINQGSQMDAILEESEEEMQTVKEGDKISEAKEGGKMENEDSVCSEKNANLSGPQQQLAMQYCVGKTSSSDSVHSPIKKLDKSLSRTTLMTDTEISVKEVLGGRATLNKSHSRGTSVYSSYENVVNHSRKNRVSMSSSSFESSAKLSASIASATSNKRLPIAAPSDPITSSTRAVFSADSADTKDSSCSLCLPPAFMLQNRFPACLLDTAQDFFTVVN